MSPARSKRTPIPQRRSRREITTAVAVAVGIVAVTAIVVWLMRPGPSGSPLGTGGLMNRQPRASWLVGVALGAGLLAGWWILRISRRARGHEKVALPGAMGVIVVAAVIGGFAWPGGLLRHDIAPPKVTTPPTTAPTTTVAGATTTTLAGATTTTLAGATTTTVAGATTTTPASTATTASSAATTTPTTGTPTTKSP